jgi:hypothetical protein
MWWELLAAAALDKNSTSLVYLTNFKGGTGKGQAEGGGMGVMSGVFVKTRIEK